MEDHIAVALVAMAVLISAAVSDWRRREASDIHWMAIMAMGAALFAVRLYDSNVPVPAYLSVVSMVLMAADLLWDRPADARIDLGLYVAIVASVVISGFSLRGTDLLWTYLSIPAMYLFMNLLYYSGAVKGGADAKAIIAIAFLYPSHPAFGELPIIDVPAGDIVYFMVPAFTVFLLASLMSVLLAIPYALVNLTRGDTSFPMMFAGFRMDIGEAERSHVWPMEDVIDGRRVTVISGSEDETSFARLRADGADRIWVTPVIPFLIPIAIAYAIVVFLGNPLFPFI